MDLLVIADHSTVIVGNIVEKGTLMVSELDVLELLGDSFMQMEEDLNSIFHENRQDG